MTPPTWLDAHGPRRPRGWPAGPVAAMSRSFGQMVNIVDHDTDTEDRSACSLGRSARRRGISQTALAKEGTGERAYVFRLEAGGSDPTVGVLQRLAKALGVPVTALLE